MKPILSAVTALLLLLSPSSDVSGQSNASGDLQSFVLAEGFYTRALGNLSPTFPSAAGGYIGYGHYFPDHLIAMAKIGYSNYRVGDNVQGTQELSAVHLLAGPHYYFTTSGFMPFVFLNVGMNFVSEVINQPSFSSDRTSVQFAWQFGLGGALRIAGPLGAQIQGKYNSHFLYQEGSTPGVPGRGNMTGFEYGLGLTWAVE